MGGLGLTLVASSYTARYLTARLHDSELRLANTVDDSIGGKRAAGRDADGHRARTLASAGHHRLHGGRGDVLGSRRACAARATSVRANSAARRVPLTRPIPAAPRRWRQSSSPWRAGAERRRCPRSQRERHELRGHLLGGARSPRGTARTRHRHSRHHGPLGARASPDARRAHGRGGEDRGGRRPRDQQPHRRGLALRAARLGEAAAGQPHSETPRDHPPQRRELPQDHR